ncbi:MAG: hypothetical protein ACOC8B_07740, partial [Gemmatimonadota bacterium]
MMKRIRPVWTAPLCALALAAAACGEAEDERAALRQEELDRELELALEGDTEPPTFEDAAAREAQETDTPAAGDRPEAGSEDASRPSSEPSREPAPRAAEGGADGRTTPEGEAEPAPAPRPQPVVRTVPTGTTFAVHLDETLSTETNRVGDPFTATLRDPIVGPNDEVLIPSGATVRGRVTGVEPSGRVGETAILRLAFEAVSFGGRSHPLQATVVEANPERRTRTTTGDDAAKVAAGTAAGAILGRVLGGDAESTVRGAVIGAAAGTAIAMGTSDVDAVLPSGSRMVIRLDTPV